MPTWTNHQKALRAYQHEERCKQSTSHLPEVRYLLKQKRIHENHLTTEGYQTAVEKRRALWYAASNVDSKSVFLLQGISDSEATDKSHFVSIALYKSWRQTLPSAVQWKRKERWCGEKREVGGSTHWWDSSIELRKKKMPDTINRGSTC